MSKKTLKPIAAALGTAFAVTLAASPVAQADSNPFGMSDLSSGYTVVAEGKCGTAKCGANKKKMMKEHEGKCSAEMKKMEGKCSAKKAEGKCSGMKTHEAKCSAAKKAEGKCSAAKSAEGKCSGKKKMEGKCAGSK